MCAHVYQVHDPFCGRGSYPGTGLLAILDRLRKKEGTCVWKVAIQNDVISSLPLEILLEIRDYLELNDILRSRMVRIVLLLDVERDIFI